MNRRQPAREANERFPNLDGMSAQREISLADPPTRRPAPGHRSLSAEQRLALLQVYQRVPGAAPPREFLQRLVTQISDIIRVKAAVAGKHEGAWVLAAESQVEPVLTIPVNGGAEGLEQFGADPARGVVLWSSGGIEWTLVSLASAPRSPVILILEGNLIDSCDELNALSKSMIYGHLS